MNRRRGLTLIELAATLAVLPILSAVLIPQLLKSRDSAKMSQSSSNLRWNSMACFSYAAEWKDRQWQAGKDDLTKYGNDPVSALTAYEAQVGDHPGLWIGWTEDGRWRFPLDGGFIASNFAMATPITFDESPFGYCRVPNARSLSMYMNNLFYDSMYYAPKDSAVLKCVQPLFEDPDEFIPAKEAGGIYWSSYCLSPAALVDPQVLRGPSLGGFVDPFTLEQGLRAPTIGQARFPELKTHIMEHHWLQNNDAGGCNPAFVGTYEGCEPYYFNASLQSQPIAAFYDGHVEMLHNDETHADDKRMRDAGEDGLWLRQPGGAVTGYFEDTAAEDIEMSHHIYTRDGIRGRDVIGH